MTRRTQLCDVVTAETQRRETLEQTDLRRLAKRGLASVQKQLEAVEVLIQKHLEVEAALGEKPGACKRPAGVGPVTAATLLAYAPELGTLSRAERSRPSPAWPRAIATVGTSAASATSVADAPRCAAPSTWPA